MILSNRNRARNKNAACKCCDSGMRPASIKATRRLMRRREAQVVAREVRRGEV